MYRARLHAWRDDRGAAVIEFALVVPLLLLLLFGIIDMSRAFYTLNNLASAVREGARQAAVMSTDPSLVANRAIVRATVTTAFMPIGQALRPESVKVEIDTVNGRPLRVRVTASYPYSPLVLPGQTILVRRNAIFRWEQSR